MYRIAVLAEQEAERQRYAEQITRFCEAKGLFPQVMQYDDQERFFETAQKDAPTNAVIALSGVAGLNAAEHLRSLCPACRMIWCSDLDFSLHAFRLRADYFLLKPVSEEAFQLGDKFHVGWHGGQFVTDGGAKHFSVSFLDLGKLVFDFPAHGQVG